MRAPPGLARVARWAVGAGIAALLSLSSAGTRADEADAQRTAAEALFFEARTLMGEGKYAEACPKLADSQRLDPGIGTLLNLGLCYKHAGKTASAWAAYREAAAMARAAGQSTREKVAQAEASELEPLLSRLVLRIGAATAQDDLEIKLDGAPIPAGLWDVPMPVDPGEHVVMATAPGKQSWSARVKIEATVTETLEVPALSDEPVVAPPPPKSVPDIAPRTTPAPAPEPREGGLGGQRIAAVVAGGIGLAGLAAGSAFGVIAMSRLDESDGECSSKNVCSDGGMELREDASSMAAWSTIGFGVGIAGLAGAAVLWLTSPATAEQPPPDDSVTVGATLSPRGNRSAYGLTLGGRW